MKNYKWVWLVLSVAALTVSVWRLVTPYKMKVSDGISKVAIDIGFFLVVGIFGFFCLFKFVQQYKIGRRQQKIVDNFGKD